MTKRALILVEGQTEERFVKDVLGPELAPLGLFLTPTILVTKVVKNGPNFKGGVHEYRKIKDHLRRLLQGAGQDGLVTTLLDYYALPSDAPGMDSRPHGTASQRVKHVEREIAKSFDNDPRLLPFLALHEFEAWLFSSPDVLPRTMMAKPEKQREFAAICAKHDCPEEIDEGPNTAPSKRIEKLFGASYQKPLHGPTTVGRIGLSAIRAKCPHLNAWIEKLASWAKT